MEFKVRHRKGGSWFSATDIIFYCGISLSHHPFDQTVQLWVCAAEIPFFDPTPIFFVATLSQTSVGLAGFSSYADGTLDQMPFPYYKRKNPNPGNAV